ncbi:MAG: hypothetical protein K1X29_09340 [Bdellovibrionales bacterium]|nr:hypothetical protein [Bdellovibrionales bacterium]
MALIDFNKIFSRQINRFFNNDFNFIQNTMVFNSKTVGMLSLSLALVLLSTGCTLRTEKGESSGDATFRVDYVVEPGVVKNDKTNLDWNIPKSRIFDFVACLRPISQKNPIVGDVFEILGGEGVYQRTTDSQGCLHWSESIPFEYFAKPTYVTVERKFKALKRQVGVASYRFGINPWSGLTDTRPPLIDFRRTNAFHVVAGNVGVEALRGQGGEGAQMFIPTISAVLEQPFTEEETRHSSDYNLHVVLEPKVLVKDMVGQRQKISLEKGSFWMTADVVKIDPSQSTSAGIDLIPPIGTPLLALSEKKLVEFSNGRVDFNVPKRLVSLIEHQSKYSLVISIEPGPNAPAKINKFYGIYSAKELVCLSQGCTFELSDQFNGWIHPDVVGQQITLLNPKVTDEEQRLIETQRGRFNFEQVSLTPATAPRIAPNQAENSISNTVVFDLSVRVADTLQRGAGVLQRAFHIYGMTPYDERPVSSIDLKQLKLKKTTDTGINGDLTWFDSIVAKTYEKRVYKKMQIVFQDVLTKNLYKACVFVAPFNKIQPIKDCRKDANEMVLTQRGIGRPTLSVGHIELKRNGTNLKDYNIITPDLFLESSFIYDFKATLNIHRADSLENPETEVERIAPAWWLVTLVMFKKNVSGNSTSDGKDGNIVPLTTFEKVFCGYKDPEMQLELMVQDLGLMQQRGFFALQFKPLKQNRLKFIEGPSPNTSIDCPGQEVATDSPIEIDDENDLQSPVHFISWIPSQSGSPIVNFSPSNYQDPKIKDLINELRTEIASSDLHVLHEKNMQKRKTIAEQVVKDQTSNKENNDWFAFGAAMLHMPYELKSTQDLKHFAITAFNWTRDKRAQWSPFVRPDPQPVGATPPSSLGDKNSRGFNEQRYNYLLEQWNKYSRHQFEIGSDFVNQKDFIAPSEPSVIDDSGAYWYTNKQHLQLLLHKIKESNIESKEFFGMLSCMDQIFWSDRASQVARCADVKTDEGKRNLEIAHWLCLVTSRNPDATDCSGTKPITEMIVEKKIHVYRLNSSRLVAGVSSSLTISSSFDVGSFVATDYGTMFSDGVTGSVTAEASYSMPVSVVKLGAGVATSLSKTKATVRFDFNREWTDNLAGFGAGMTLSNQEMIVELELGEYRKCYIVRFDMNEKSGLYICEGITSDSPLTLKEHYYVLFNPVVPELLLDSADQRNHMVVQMRGQRSYYRFLSHIDWSLRPFHLNGISRPVGEMVRTLKLRIRDEEVERANATAKMETDSSRTTANLNRGPDWAVNSRVTENLKRGPGWAVPYVIDSSPPESSAYRVNIEKLRERDMPIFGFQAFQDLINDRVPNGNVHDAASEPTRAYPDDRAYKSYGD